MESKKEGFLFINKDKTWTSFDVVKKIRNMTGIKKVGHSGTLDPLATGVLIIAVGKQYTKQLANLLAGEKIYKAVIKLGYTTESLDREKEELFMSDYIPSEDEILNILKSFEGEQEQLPPIYSAVQIKGQRLYKLAREGMKANEIDIPKRKIKIFFIDLLTYNYPFLELRLKVSAGIYIRSIVRDLGEKLKTSAYLYDLEREELKNVKITDCIKIKDLNSDNYINYLKDKV